MLCSRPREGDTSQWQPAVRRLGDGHGSGTAGAAVLERRQLIEQSMRRRRREQKGEVEVEIEIEIEVCSNSAARNLLGRGLGDLVALMDGQIAATEPSARAIWDGHAPSPRPRQGRLSQCPIYSLIFTPIYACHCSCSRLFSFGAGLRWN